MTSPGTAQPGRKRLTRAEQKAQTRQSLLEAAGDVFRRRGFSGSSVEEIAETAGFTRGAFYSNFDSKEQLFIELLHDRVYSQFRGMIENAHRAGTARDQLLATADALKRMYEESAERWVFELWLECLAHAARHSEFAELPATFWSGTRAFGAGMIESVYRDADASPPVESRHLASAMIALDIGLAIQNLVDPEAVPLRLYPELYELLFGQLLPKPS